MRRGCIASEELQCEGCNHIIPYATRYLTINEENGVEEERGKLVRYCVKCALEKGYASYKEEKEGKVLTFFL